MKEDFLKSILIVEENFEVNKLIVEKWKNAHFRDYEIYYQEMFNSMRKNLKTLNAHKVQCWLEISAYYFNFKSKNSRTWNHNIIPMEIEK